MAQFIKRSRIEAPAAEVFAWHCRPGALERLMPPWDESKVIWRKGGVEVGAQVLMNLRTGPIRQKLLAEHVAFEEGRLLRDKQVRGPFGRWEHTHLVEPDGDNACFLEDNIRFSPPLGPLGLLGLPLMRRILERAFDYRHKVTRWDVAQHLRWKGRSMKILVTGSTGLVGEALIPFLTTGGHSVSRMVRKPSQLKEGDVLWRPHEDRIDAEKLEGFDAVIHLAGENVAQFWTPEAKRRIYDSRVHATELLCKALGKLRKPPKVLICASAVGFYGSRPGETLVEGSSPGLGFLANVVRNWEQATIPATQAGIRVVNLRFGVVLSPRGGALKKMLLPFKLGLAGKFGSGRQYFPWVSIDDAVGAAYFALMNDTISGPINVTAPTPVTNKAFTKTMGRVLLRPTLFCVPAPLFYLIPGGMGVEMFLCDLNVLPGRLTQSGYTFKHTQLADALRHLLGKSKGKVEFTAQSPTLAGQVTSA